MNTLTAALKTVSGKIDVKVSDAKVDVSGMYQVLLGAQYNRKYPNDRRRNNQYRHISNSYEGCPGFMGV